ncbi:MAG: 1-acyl-sn-glycerol-3-phosphate acyltransferase [Neisseriaceae bacterium]|nr:MAG: 1-acyl-sn-glycerol-3-phosphate acyltransferase [Neisseriaceae bacterium]
MILLRSILFLVYLPLTMFVYLVACILFIPFMDKTTPNRIAVYWSRTALWGLKKIVGLSFEVKGMENIPKDRVYITVANHQSGMETSAIYSFSPISVYILKQELLSIPLLGFGLYLTNQIPIKRGDPNSRKNMLKIAKEKVEDGLGISIFPEGTRIQPGKYVAYKRGAAHLAKDLKLDLLPIAHNCGEFYSKGLKKYPGKATFIIGKPIAWNAKEDPRELTELIQKTVQSAQKEIEGVGPLYNKQ